MKNKSAAMSNKQNEIENKSIGMPKILLEIENKVIEMQKILVEIENKSDHIQEIFEEIEKITQRDHRNCLKKSVLILNPKNYEQTRVKQADYDESPVELYEQESARVAKHFAHSNGLLPGL